MKINEKLAEFSFMSMGADGPKSISTSELCAGKKVVIFALPGAFTPTCTDTHFPEFFDQLADFHAKGVDTVACLATNDHLVMQAWAKSMGDIEGKILMLSDGEREFIKLSDTQFDLHKVGLGMRSQRYAIIVDDGTISYFGLDESGLQNSTAQAVLAQL